MSRYLEWTAVSYFTNSTYGRCKDSTHCTTVAVNSTTRTGGNYYTMNVEQSTTNNVYGIYDMASIRKESIMAFLNGFHQIQFITLPDSKYYDVFMNPRNTTYYQNLSSVNWSSDMNGVYKEFITSVEGINFTWYHSDARTPSRTSPWFVMGHHSFFFSGFSDGGPSSGTITIRHTFRLVLINK